MAVRIGPGRFAHSTLVLNTTLAGPHSGRERALCLRQRPDIQNHASHGSRRLISGTIGSNRNMSWSFVGQLEGASAGRDATWRCRMPRAIRIVRTIDDPRLEVVLPSRTFRENRKWLKSAVPGKRIQPDWDADARCWRVAKANFTDLVHAMADRYGKVRVEIEYNPRAVCTESCRNAEGNDCECSCLGRSHGGGAWLDGWIDLGEVAVGHEGRTRIAYDVRRDLRVGRLTGPGPEQWYCPKDDQWFDASDWTTEVDDEPGHWESWHNCPNGHGFPGLAPYSRRGAMTKARAGDGTPIRSRPLPHRASAQAE
ncbi:hypothetical protein GA0115256_103517 [Streptomyces sp. DconLS]|nr:hypothetical protein GA0115258_10161 [Streptomyces sp. LamerLS-31b]SCF59086.1 hypothetical protein GA0115256_103517 [Streptomyces sp. DconLS]